MSSDLNGNGKKKASDHNQEAVLSEVRKALETIDFGSVLIKIHQGEVVGIETSTKVKLSSN